MNDVGRELALHGSRPTSNVVARTLLSGWSPRHVADLDRLLHAMEGRTTAGLSLASLWLAFADWSIHDSRQMAGAFQMLRSNDLIWSRLVRSYMLGRPEIATDLMAWNADGTRLPARMCGEYLRQLFLDDELSEGRFEVEGRPVSISDIRVPIFAVATEVDHVAPWRSVHKIHLLNEGEVTFVLASGGHNAGIVSEPGHPHRSFRMRHRPAGDRYVGPVEWETLAEEHEGSWWPEWERWLSEHSGAPTTPPPLDAPGAGYGGLDDAPGRYILEH